MKTPAPAEVSARSRRLVSFAQATNESRRDADVPPPTVKAVDPPSETRDKDTTVQNWLDNQPNSPCISIPSIAQGPTATRRKSDAVKRLFISPKKKALKKNTPGTRGKRIPFKRGRGSGGSSVKSITNSPGTNWRKQVPTITVTTTISPAKPLGSDSVLHADANPNILIEVATTSDCSPGKWNVVSYRNEIGSPAVSGVWHVDNNHISPETGFSNVDHDIISPLHHPLPPLDDVGSHDVVSSTPKKRKRALNAGLRKSPAKVQMVCGEGVSTEFYVNCDSDIDVDDPGENNNTNNQESSLPDNSDYANQDRDLPTNSETTTNGNRKRVDTPRENTRKRVTNTSRWKLAVAKKGFNDGTEYVTSRGVLKPAREMKAPCSEKCNRCQRKLTPDERQDIFDNFWALADIARKRDFISRLIDENVPMTCSTSPECAKKSVRRYHFVIGEEEVKVCKTMFLNTLGISDCWIETTLRKITSNGLKHDGRGKHVNRPTRISEATLQSVRTHINTFPRMYSHYTRERTKREYLETNVHSTERMHKLYEQWAPKNGVEKVASISTYRKVFNTEFNLGFFLPRKDQCETCAKWKHCCNPEERRAMVQDYALHLQNKKAVTALRTKDKAEANESKCVACFDLQKVLTCPRSEVSLFFYHNKISLYNFTIFDLRPKEGHCYLWTEVDACKGANEIGTNLLHFLERKVKEGAKEFYFYSDSPSGQNRNRMIFSLYLYASAKFDIKITHRFLESGHSYSEADSMHGRIETEAKIKQEIFTPEEWESLIKTAKQDGPSYVVNQLKNEEVLDLHALVDKENWEKDSMNSKVFWSRVREVAADCKSPNCIFFRYNFSDAPSKVTVRLKSGGLTDMKTYNFPPAYKAKFPLPEKKKKDIRNLMRKGAIPPMYHNTFDRYLAI